MITLEPPRRSVTLPDSWEAWGLSRLGLARFVTRAKARIGLDGRVDVLLSGDAALRRLNRQFRGKDKATDVLSFPSHHDFAEEHAGDLAISLETARKQAKEHGHSLESEVRVLILHGLLHLAGMDHETDNGQMGLREMELRIDMRLPAGLIGRASTPRDVLKRKAVRQRVAA